MEKNRRSLIFIGLCLIFAFSMSPVEAQMHHDCGVCAHCDRDGDELIKDTPPCRTNCPVEDGFEFDLNDREPFDGEPNMCRGGDPEPEPMKVEICHKQNFPKHCLGFESDVAYGGAVRLVQMSKVQDHLDKHDGDCTNFVADVNVCANHCVCDDDVGFGPFR